MKVTRLAIEDVLLIELDVYEDERGFFVARFHAQIAEGDIEPLST